MLLIIRNGILGKLMPFTAFSVGIFMLSSFIFPGPGNDIKFQRLGLEEGLSQSIVFSILQDSRGFMWFGTEDGLNLYDGYKFEVFRNKPGDVKSLSYNYIKSIAEDENGAIWIGTYGRGLNKLEPSTRTFTRYRSIPQDHSTLSSDFINSLCIDSRGCIWIATDNGLNKFDPDRNRFTRFVHDPADPESICGDKVNSVYCDKSGTIWAAADSGLSRWEQDSRKFITPSLIRDRVLCILESGAGVYEIGTEKGLNRLTGEGINSWKLPQDQINSLYEDRNGVLWVGTLNGLIKYDDENRIFIRYKNEPGNPKSLSDNEIFSVYGDRTGVLWVGTRHGISKFDQKRKRFFHVYSRPDDSESLGDNHVRSFLEAGSGDIWVGSHGSLDLWKRSRNSFIHYKAGPDDRYSLSNNRVMSLCRDESGLIWVGTYGGIDIFDTEKKVFSHYRHDAEDPESLSSNKVRSAAKDRSGGIWIGTENGLNKFDREKEKFIRYKSDSRNPKSLSHNFVYSIYEDSRGTIWVGTLNGLNIFNRRNGEFQRFFADPENPGSLSNSEILCIFEDSSGVMWFGTPGGLNRYHRDSGAFSFISEKDGLPNDLIYSVLEDERGRLWLSTNQGLSRFDPKTGEFRNFDVKDGLQSNEFNLGAAMKTKEGEMFFGGINGFNHFFPEEIKDNPYLPPVVITDFQIYNKSALRKSLIPADSIRISYKERMISFEFAALHYAAPEKNRYAYKMEGFEKEWNYPGTRRFATYTNLSPGKYVFNVIASNNDGLWNEKGASVRLTVTPPFWQTWWFRGLAAFSGLLILGMVYNIRTYKIRMRNRELEERVEARTSELREANIRLKQEVQERTRAEKELAHSLKEKEVLLQEIHHRVKNNMQIISSLLRLQFSQTKDKKVGELFQLCQNRIKSMALIHEKLYQSKDFSKIDFSGYLKSLIGSLRLIYQKESAEIDIRMDMEKIHLNINRSIPMGLIANELISNSFKHAFSLEQTLWEEESQEEKSWIKVVLKESREGWILFEVCDNGKGIPSDLDLKKTDNLGLQLVQDLVEQLEGNLDIASGKGVCFQIEIPRAAGPKPR